MTVINQNIIPAKLAEDVQTTQYTVPVPTLGANRFIIDSFTATNVGSVESALSCNLVTAGGSAIDGNKILDTRRIAIDETYACPELIGQVLEQGDFISTLAGDADALVIRASGRLISS